jgi:uncharacterized membrane protein YgcG
MNQHEIKNDLLTRLEEIKSVPARNEKAQRLGRAAFLNEALNIEGTVSAQKFLRHRRWISIGKEKLLMNAVLSLIVIAGLLFGGGATVSAAQDALPGEPLYALKTAGEDFNLQFQNDPELRVTHLMELAQIRTQEMVALAENGQVPPEAVVTRLEQHIREALQTCTSMDDATLDRTLLQIRDQLRQQDRDMDQIKLHVNSDALPLFEQTRTMLQSRLQLVEDGLLNHEQFRNAVRNGQEDDLTPPTPNGEQNQEQQQDQNSEQNSEQNREQNNEQIGQPTSAPGGPNTDPGGPNSDATPGSNNDNGSGSGNGTNTESGSGGNENGGSGSGGTPSDGNSTGGSGSGGNKP